MNAKLERSKGMTVSELREALESFSDDTPVHFSYNFGDHSRTVAAQGVKAVDELPVQWDDYIGLPRVSDEDDEDALTAVVLS